MLSCIAEMLQCRTFHSAQSAEFYQSELGKSWTREQICANRVATGIVNEGFAT